MPHANIWIRKEDWEKWLSVTDRPRLIHDALWSTDLDKYNKSVVERKKIEKLLKPALKQMKAGVTYKKTSNWGA